MGYDGPKLLIMSGQRDVGQEAPITRPMVLIGSAATCDIVLHDPSVAPEHALLYRAEDGYRIEAIAPDRGVAVNGVALDGPALLAADDLIQFGNVHTLFQYDPSAAPTFAPVAPPPIPIATAPAGGVYATSAIADEVEPAPLAVGGPPSRPSLKDDVASLIAWAGELQTRLQSLVALADSVDAAQRATEAARDAAVAETRALREQVRAVVTDGNSALEQNGLPAVIATVERLVENPDNLRVLVRVSEQASQIAACLKLLPELLGRLEQISAPADSAPVESATAS
ncbi:MAG: FHA domain-containing protein [Dehalococcoidia bacterium]|nr:FHA domain-containing protein [Dehalococcoidia bacterium]